MAISEKCKTTYDKLNTFVTNVINRDVTPQITSLNETTTSLQETKLAKGDWTILSNTESYVTTKADIITNNAWHDENEIATITQTTITVINDGYLDYFNSTNKKVSVKLSINGRVMIHGSIVENITINLYVDANKNFSILCYSGTSINYTVGTQSNIISSIIDVAYPIGSIYISSSTIHPSITFGGTWEHFAEDKFLLSAGSTYANGSTGGSATVTLTSAQSGVPAHSHKYQDYNTTYTLKTTNRKPGTSTAVAYGTSLTAGGGATERTSSNNTAANASQAHENMPPYLAVYMWERVG